MLPDTPVLGTFMEHSWCLGRMGQLCSPGRPAGSTLEASTARAGRLPQESSGVPGGRHPGNLDLTTEVRKPPALGP